MSELSLRPLANYDPLRNLIQRLRLSPISFGVLIFILDLVVDGLICVLYYYLINPGISLIATPSNDTFGLREDYMALITDFFYTPVIAGVYYWSLDGSKKVFQQLIDSRVFMIEQDLKGLLDRYRPIYNSKVAFYAIFSISILFALFQIIAYRNPNILGETVGGYIYLWPDASFGRAPFWFLMFYSVLFSAFNVGVTIFVLRNSFKSYDIQLMPLHPDKCGGLGGINQYSNTIALGVGSIGLLMSAATIMQLQTGKLQETYPVLLGIVAYVMFAPLFFFLPLGTAHEAMRDAKDAELLKLANTFRSVYNNVKVSVDKSDKKLNVELGRLDNIKKLYALVESFPVWPFDVHSLRRFLAVVTTPLLPAFVTIINELFSEIFHR